MIEEDDMNDGTYLEYTRLPAPGCWNSLKVAFLLLSCTLLLPMTDSQGFYLFVLLKERSIACTSEMQARMQFQLLVIR